MNNVKFSVGKEGNKQYNLGYCFVVIDNANNYWFMKYGNHAFGDLSHNLIIDYLKENNITINENITYEKYKEYCIQHKIK